MWFYGEWGVTEVEGVVLLWVCPSDIEVDAFMEAGERV